VTGTPVRKSTLHNIRIAGATQGACEEADPEDLPEAETSTPYSITVQSSPVILDTFLMSQCVLQLVSFIPSDTTQPPNYRKNYQPCHSKPLIISEPLIPSGVVRIHSFHSPAILLRPYIFMHTSTKLPSWIARSLRSQLTQNIVTFSVYNS